MLRIIRRPELLKQVGLTDSGLDRAIRDGFVPPPVKLSPDPTRRAVGWPAHEIDEIIAARIAGLDPDATRTLVADLVERRLSAVAAAAPTQGRVPA
ncbi:MAG TPA: AlpA family phage regulatory protein [Rhodanobacteraceae bacterium]